ncbi:MAG: MFS transporter [Massilibacteroides sp.]|nr:MFS transporter [Massilibacteroides sp.]MDD3061668.1 MFS transporter [Massilibacteroides sp.]MDD4114289.1 MFS transporter [Massilibacteroides sp.]MDD4660287.1 MFS transporter [Massilibacteroides sp.]
MEQQNKQNYLLPIIMMVFLFGMIAFVTNLAAPMGKILINQFGVSNAEGLLGNLANFIAYAVMGIPGGIMLEKLGYKKTALIAIGVGLAGVFIQYLSGGAGSFAIYLVGAFVAGFSMCLLNMVVNPMLNTLGGGGNKGNQLIQIGGSFNSVMGTLTPMLVGVLVGEISKANITDVYPVLYIAMGVFAFAFIVIALSKLPEPHAEKTKEALSSLMLGALKFRHFVLGAFAIFVYVGVEVGTPGILDLWLVKGVGISTTISGFVCGTYWFLMLCGRLIGASIGGKVSSKIMLTITSGTGLILVGLAILLPVTTLVNVPVLQTDAVGSLGFGLAEVPINALLLLLVGLCTSIMWGSIFNLAVEGLGKYLAAASGIFMVLVCGGGILPWIQGRIADIGGYQISYIVIALGLAYLLYYAAIGSKNVNKDIPVD